MLVILTAIFTVALHYTFAINKTIDDLPRLEQQSCDFCERVYFPVCATDNRTYTNECRFRCINNQRKENERFKMIRFGPCILGS